MDKKTLIIGVILGAFGMYLLIHLLWHLGYYAVMGMLSICRSTGAKSPSVSKSLSSIETMTLPQVLRDFPEFDSEAIKSKVSQAVSNRYGSKEAFAAGTPALIDYRRDSKEHRLIYQTAVSWKEKKSIKRKLKITVSPEIFPLQSPAHCPDCGAEIQAQDRHCRSCGKALPSHRETSWTVCHIQEA